MFHFSSIQRKFTVILIGYLVAASAVLGVLVSTALDGSLREQFYTTYRANGRGMAEHITSDWLDWVNHPDDERARHLVNYLRLVGIERAVIEGESGRPQYDSQPGAPWPELIGSPPIVSELSDQAALAGVRWQQRPNRGLMEMRFAAQPSGAPERYTVNLLVGDRAVAAQARSEVIPILALIAFTIAIAAYLVTMLTRSLLYPLEELAAAAGRVASGDFSARASVVGSDEISSITSTFNRMVGQLGNTYQVLRQQVEQRTAELERSRVALEEEVARRTAELTDTKRSLEAACDVRTQELAKAKAILEAKMAETEKMNTFLVNREVAMVELKERVASLQAQLDQHQRSADGGERGRSAEANQR